MTESSISGGDGAAAAHPASKNVDERSHADGVVGLASLDWLDLVAQLAEQARSALGRARCEALADPAQLAPDAATARERMAIVAEAAAVLRTGQAFPGLAFLDVGPVLNAAERGEILGLDDLRPVAETCDIAAEARRFFGADDVAAAATASRGGPPVQGTGKDRGRDKGGTGAGDPDEATSTPLLARSVAGLEPRAALARNIRVTFDPSGQVRDDVSPELARLRREREATSARVRSEIERLMQGDEYAHILQDRFWTLRQDRYVLPLKASAKSMGLGIVHDSSRTGETVFVEPMAVVDLNNRVKLADLQIEHEIRRILEELSAAVADAAIDLRANLVVLTELDVICALARLGVAYRGHPGVLVEDTFVDLRQARHPLLVLRAAKQGFSVVANDVTLGQGAARVLVISGPNAGGKTVYLKTIGLAALMVRAGMLLPAGPGSRVGFFQQVLPDIGDRQSVMGDLSTFSAHLATLGQILRLAEAASHTPGARALVLLDELMGGTNPEQGAALARATLEALAELGDGVLVVATTHADALKALAETDPRFENAGMEYDGAGLAPTFRVRIGVPGRSYALDIATRMGLPAGVLARARELAGGTTLALEEVIATLEAREAELARETERIAEARVALQSSTEDQRAAVQALEKRERELARHSRAAVELAVREAREAIRAIVRQAQETGSARAAEAARVAVAQTAQAALRELPAEPASAAAARAADHQRLKAGARVRVAALGAFGTVVKAPDEKGRLKVAIGKVTVDVHLTELGDSPIVTTPAPPSVRRPDIRRAEARARALGAGPEVRSAAASGHPQAGSSEALAWAVPSAANTLDLRGRRADDVVDAVESYLDRAALEDRSPVVILHGHGTGALKKIVRDYLAASTYVRRFAPGGKGQGGDGVTIVEI